MKEVILNFFYFISGFSARKKNRFVFGAWFGQRYSDNPKYIFEYLIANYPDNEYYWICEKDILNKNKSHETKKNVYFLKRNSLKSLIILLTSSYGFVSHGYSDLASLNLFRKGKLVQLWHGFPIKKIVADGNIKSEKEKKYYDNYDFFLSSSSEETTRFLSAFKFKGINLYNIIETGKPRNDYLLSNRNFEIRNKLNLSLEKKIVVYLPTYRNSKDIFSFLNISQEYKKRLSNQNILLIEKQHFVKKDIIQSTIDENILIADEKFDTQELLCIADLLITDYSSVYIDFCLLNRPIVHFLFDGDKYTIDDQGVYESFIKEACGPIVYELSDLINNYILKIETGEFLNDKRIRNNHKFNEYTVNNNSEKLIQILLGKRRD